MAAHITTAGGLAYGTNPRKRAHFTVALTTAALLVSASAGYSSEKAERCLRVQLVDHVGLGPEVTDILAREVVDLWSAHGVQLDTAPRGWNAEPPAETVYVLVRYRTPADDDGTETGSAGPMPPHHSNTRVTGRAISLAWTPFVGRRAGTHIFVSVERTQQLLRTLEYEGRRIDRCPAMLGRVLLARALGRIIAHEIGHCLYGPSHEKGGLMKVMLTGQDLLGIPEPPIVIAGRALR